MQSNKEEVRKKREAAIEKIIQLLNENDLTMKIEHNIKIVPTTTA